MICAIFSVTKLKFVHGQGRFEPRIVWHVAWIQQNRLISSVRIVGEKMWPHRYTRVTLYRSAITVRENEQPGSMCVMCTVSGYRLHADYADADVASGSWFIYARPSHICYFCSWQIKLKCQSYLIYLLTGGSFWGLQFYTFYTRCTYHSTHCRVPHGALFLRRVVPSKFIVHLMETLSVPFPLHAMSSQTQISKHVWLHICSPNPSRPGIQQHEAII